MGTHGWHELLDSATALVLVAAGLPILALSARATRRRHWRPSRPAGVPRGALLAFLATTLWIGTLGLALAAARSPLGEATVLSVGAAALGAIGLHAARGARVGSLSVVPLVGLAGIAALILIAAPDGRIEHHAHDGHAIVRAQD